MITRRVLLKFSGAVFAAGAVTRHVTAATVADAARTALDQSDVVYITPLKQDSSESTCHAEVWFVLDGGDLLVVTGANAWRATAVTRGLTRARMWVGEFGAWKDAKEAYRAAPELLATAAFVNDAQIHARALERFGAKYPLGWLYYEGKFRDGLKDGSRVMLRYTPTA